jgi:anti-sigma B factor antagonist
MTYQVTSQAFDRHTDVIGVAGEIDLYAAPELKERVARAIEEGRTRLVVDLSEATFIDSTGVGVLVGAQRRLEELGGSLDLVCTNRNVMRVLEIVGLERAFGTHESLEDAMASLPALA